MQQPDRGEVFAALSPSSSEVEHLFLIGTRVHAHTVHMCICTWLATQSSTNSKHSTHTNTSCLILCPSLVDEHEIPFVENMCAVNIHTILTPPVPGLQTPRSVQYLAPGCLVSPVADTGHPQLPHAQTNITGLLMSRSRPIWLYTSSHSPRPLVLSNSQFTDIVSSPDL